jgi:hypothetical protein
MPIYDLVIPLVQKTAGILFAHQANNKMMSVMIKSHNSEMFKVISVRPHVPQCKNSLFFNDSDCVNFESPLNLVSVAELARMSGGKISKLEKVQFLSWILDVPMTVEKIDSIPSEFFIDVMACTYLLNTKAISMPEARVLMQSIVDSHNDTLVSNTEYPKFVSERAFRVSFLYTKLFIWISSCFAAVGLKCYTVSKYSNLYSYIILMFLTLEFIAV